MSLCLAIEVARDSSLPPKSLAVSLSLVREVARASGLISLSLTLDTWHLATWQARHMARTISTQKLVMAD